MGENEEDAPDVVRHTDMVTCPCGWTGIVTTYANPGENAFPRREEAVLELTEKHRAEKHPKSPRVHVGKNLNLRGGARG
jgi:hypothetical protein